MDTNRRKRRKPQNPLKRSSGSSEDDATGAKLGRFSPIEVGETLPVEKIISSPAVEDSDRLYGDELLSQYEALQSRAMTNRARRIIANARERNRVHTISTAFEDLRRAIPLYSTTQKLSKLAILRIAAVYIQILSRLAGYEPPRGGKFTPSLTELITRYSATIQSEGKLRKNNGINLSESDGSLNLTSSKDID